MQDRELLWQLSSNIFLWSHHFLLYTVCWNLNSSCKKEKPQFFLLSWQRVACNLIFLLSLHVSGILYTPELLLFSGVTKSLVWYYFVHLVLRVCLIHQIFLSILPCFHRHECMTVHDVCLVVVNELIVYKLNTQKE
jgi:hypothetical protein